ncbi:MAG: hypothetical protein IJ661_03200 [Lachnospiraceae bacterium]|nr:hypothetical protein [Lachnospiraceae bacterium]
MDTSTIHIDDELLRELDKGIDDYEAGRVTPLDEAMVILRQRLHDYAEQYPVGRRSS